MQDIALINNCSLSTVAYWMKRYAITRRSRSDATYLKHNPTGDPFIIEPVVTPEQAKLQGIGIGLYWGEGTKSNIHSVRLGNTDPELLKIFIRFLIELYHVQKNDFRFGLQIFTDIDEHEALRYWCNELAVKPSQFYKITVTISGSLGTYRKKSPYGVVTIYYNNKKLRDHLMSLLPR